MDESPESAEQFGGLSKAAKEHLAVLEKSLPAEHFQALADSVRACCVRAKGRKLVVLGPGLLGTHSLNSPLLLCGNGSGRRKPLQPDLSAKPQSIPGLSLT